MQALPSVLIVSGTRPEIIKLAPVYYALQKAGWSDVHWLHTGQHQEMASQMLREFELEPDYALQREGSSLLDFGTGCRHQLEVVLGQKKWALVVVQGDTESAFQGALAAFYNKVPVAHVEAGLRTHDLCSPFPEEGLRQMISRLAQFHFAPTRRAQLALQCEGIPAERIHMTGNTVVDAQQWTARRHAMARHAERRGHLLVTVHRRENWGTDLAEICHAVADIAHAQPEVPVLFPVHLNPAVSAPVHAILQGIANVALVPPLGYRHMQQALADAWLVLTDSGGLQEEAPTYGVPVLVLRRETERPEAVEAGCALLIGASRSAIVREVARLAADTEAYARMAQTASPFGNGTAAAQINAVLAQALAVRLPARHSQTQSQAEANTELAIEVADV